MTDSTGQAQTTLVSPVAEAKQVTASFTGGSALANVTFLPGVPAASTSSLTANVTAVVADGNHCGLVTAFLADLQGNALPGQAIVLDKGDANSTSTPSSDQSSAQGTFISCWTSTVAQSHTMTATAGTAVLSLSLPFVAGPAAAANTAVTVMPSAPVANGVSAALISLHLADAFGNPVPHAAVTLGATGSANLWSSTTGATDASGNFAATLASTVAQTKTVTVTVAGLTQTRSLTFVPGPVSAGLSTFVASGSQALADGKTLVDLTAALQDAFGNTITGFAVGLSTADANTHFVPATGATDANGSFASTVASTDVGMQILTATAASTGVVLNTNVTFLPGAPSSSCSTLSASPNVLVANGVTPATLTLSLADALGHPIPSSPVSWSGSLASASPLPTVGVTGPAGLATSQVMGSAAGTTTVMATFTGGSLSVPVTLVAGSAASGTSTLSLSPNSTVTADGNTLAYLRVQVADASGNPVSGQSVTFTASGSANTFSSNTVTTNAAGSATTALSSTLAQLETVRATFGTNGPSVSALVTFVPSAPDPNVSTLTAVPASLTANNASVSNLTLAVRDMHGNAIPSIGVTLAASGTQNTLTPGATVTDASGFLVATLSSSRAQTQVITATLASAQSPNVAATVTFVPGPASTQTTTFSVNPNTVVADGTHAAQLALQFYDVFGNAVTAVFGAASLVANANFVPGPASASTSSIVAAPASVTADGATPIVLTVLAKDAYSNVIASTPVALTGSGSNIVFAPAASGNTTSSGTYISNVTSTLTQSQNITAALGAGPQASVSVPTTFVAGPASATSSTLVASPATFVANNVTQTTLTTNVRDAYGNAVANQNVILAVPGRNLTLSAMSGRTGTAGTFAPTLSTTTAQTLGAVATVNGLWTLSTTAQAVQGPASQFKVVGLAGGTAQVTSSPQVAALDAYSNVVTGYLGTIGFTCSDTAAVLPSNSTFLVTDAGSHTFASGVTLVTPGTQQVSVTDTSNAGITGSQTGIVITAPVYTSIVLPLAAQPAVCFGVQNGNATSGTPLVANTCTNAVDEVFALGTDNTLHVLNNCVQVQNGVYAAGKPVQAATCTAAQRQRWLLLSTGALAAVGNPNFCLDLSSTTAGTAATLQLCSGTTATQLFAPRAISPAFHLVNAGLNQALKVTAATYTAGTKLQNNVFSNGPHQAFLWGNDYTLRSHGLCVDVVGGALNANAALQLAVCAQTATQKFIPTGQTLVAASNSNYCVDTGLSSASHATVVNVCNGSAGQTFATHVNAQFYAYLPQSGLATPQCIEVAGAATASSTAIQVNPCANTYNQAWALNPNGGQSVQFGPSCVGLSGLLIDLLGLNLNLANVLSDTCNSGTASQTWRALPSTGHSYLMQLQGSPTYCWNGAPTSTSALELGTCSATNPNQGLMQLAKSVVMRPNTNPTQCIDVAGGLPVAGAALQYNACGMSTSQSFSPATDGSLQYSGLCVDAGTTPAVGNALTLANCSYATAQKWQLQYVGATLTDGALQSVANPNLCVDTSSVVTGTTLHLASCGAGAGYVGRACHVPHGSAAATRCGGPSLPQKKRVCLRTGHVAAQQCRTKFDLLC